MAIEQHVQFWGGPRDGESVLVPHMAPDGLRASVVPGEGFYVLTTFPHGPTGKNGLKRLWAWWGRPLEMAQ